MKAAYWTKLYLNQHHNKWAVFMPFLDNCYQFAQEMKVMTAANGSSVVGPSKSVKWCNKCSHGTQDCPDRYFAKFILNR